MKKIFIFFIILIFIGVLSFIGYYFYKQNNENNNTENNETVSINQTDFKYKAQISDLILNSLDNKGKSKFIKMAFSVKSNNEKIEEIFLEKDQEIKDILIDLAMIYKANELITNDGRTLFKKDILNKINYLLSKDNVRISQIYFLEFLIK